MWGHPWREEVTRGQERSHEAAVLCSYHAKEKGQGQNISGMEIDQFDKGKSE